MFDFYAMFKQVAAAVSVSFVGAFPAAALAGDLTASKAAVVGAIAAGIGVAAGLAGNLIKQLIDRARGFLKAGADEAVALLAEAQAKIAEAKRALV